MKDRNPSAGCSLMILLNDPGEAALDVQCLSPDHIAYFRSQDLEPRLDEGPSNFQAFLEWIGKPLDDVLLGGGGSSKQLEVLLNGIEEKTLPGCRLLIAGFRITGQQFRRILTRYGSVTLMRCHFLRGWWQAPSERVCIDLSFIECIGVLPQKSRIGRAAGSHVKWLTVSATDGHSLGDKAQTERFAQAAVTAFWGDSLEDLTLTDIQSLDYLTSFPPRSSIESMSFVATPISQETLNWVVQHKNIRSLDLSWLPGASLDWAKLAELRRLRHLDVSETPFGDHDLVQVVRHCRLRSLVAHYTNLTSTSWPLILSWPSLKSFWASQNMSGDQVPEGLPEKTSLKEFVALNARTDWFTRLLSVYPQVKIVEM